jgi:putative peptidoglycan lipid II flippase
MVGLIILGKPIIGVIFERGAFDVQSKLMTNYALVFYSLGLWAFAGIRVMVAAFYALQDTKTPVKTAIVALIANLVFSLGFMGPFKHGGLALALSLASSLQFCLLVFLLNRKIQIRDLRATIVSVVKCTFAAAVMGLAIHHLHSKWLATYSASGLLSTITSLTCLIVSGMIIYFAVARLLGCRELASLRDILRPFFRKRGE